MCSSDLHDESVVNDLVAHVDGSAVQADRALDDADGALDAGTEAPGIGKQNFHAVDSTRSGAGAFPPQAVENQQCRTDRDPRIRDVERRPVPASRVKIEKIHHMAEHDPVPQVADRAAENHGQSGAEQALVAMPDRKSTRLNSSH